MRWGSLLIIALLALSACTRNDAVEGVKSQADLTQKLGVPQTESAPVESHGVKILHYPGGRAYQIEQDRVVAVSRKPSAEESKLQHWLHLKAATDPDPKPVQCLHDQCDFSLTLPSLRTTVVYSSIGEVLRVIEYGQK